VIDEEKEKYKMYRETKTRSWTKSILWRVIATANSFAILTSALTDKPLTNAIYMNITGLFIYYFYERIWNYIFWGKVKVTTKNLEQEMDN
jgi:hypothetical protein